MEDGLVDKNACVNEDLSSNPHYLHKKTGMAVYICHPSNS